MNTKNRDALSKILNYGVAVLLSILSATAIVLASLDEVCWTIVACVFSVICVIITSIKSWKQDNAIQENNKKIQEHTESLTIP